MRQKRILEDRKTLEGKEKYQRNHLPPGTKMNQVRTQQNHPQNTQKMKMCLTSSTPWKTQVSHKSKGKLSNLQPLLEDQQGYFAASAPNRILRIMT